jgi:hypothetical protein
LEAWQESIAQQTQQNPSLKHQLIQQQGELLPCFANHYDRLKALPRHMRRSLQRKWKQSLAGVALLLALSQALTMAATINVGGTCTLPRAITLANNDAAVGGCAAGFGADTIRLPANSTQLLTAVSNTMAYYGPTGLPTIRSPITIDGNNSTIRRSPTAPNFRVFTVLQAGSLTLQQTTISGGTTGPTDFGGAACSTSVAMSP